MPSVLSQSVIGPLRGIPRDGDGDGLIHDGTPRERPVPPAPTPPARAPGRMRPIVAAGAVRRGIYERVRQAASALPPIANQRHTLALTDVGYEGPTEFPISEWKRAILSGRSLGARLRGTWTLTDNATGAVVDRRRSTVATVPYVTDHGTFIQNGSEYTLGHQLRLRPGVFTRRQENGELEAHVNVLPGKGLSHRIYLEPDTGVFRLRIGQAHMALLPLLRALGADDRALRATWGQEIYQANQLKDDPSVVGKLHARLVRRPAADKTAEQEVREAFEAMPLDPDVTLRTLGKPHDRVDLDTLLAATRKLIAVNRGEAEPDDRDHLAYMTIHGPEDLLAERVGRDRMLLGKVLWKASMTGGLKHVPPELLTRGIQAGIMSSGLGQPTEGINPAMIFDQQARVSRLGEGGIPSMESVPAEARNVQPSHFGYIDPLVTPESLKVGVDSRLTRAARKGEDGRLYAPFRDVRTGKTEWKSAQDLTDAVIAFPGELRKLEPYVNALVGGRARPVPRNRVQYELPEMEDAFSAISNMVPIKSTVKGQREVMAGRMITQALPVIDPEAPLVQAGVPGSQGDSYEAQYGPHFGALRSDVDGVVVSVSPDEVVLRGGDGRERKLQLYDNYPYNRKTYIHQTPVVRPGDHVRAGALLARSNYTDDKGVAALGKNARVAYVPFRGLNFEDAIVVSESFAKRMTSEHMYQHALDRADGVQAGKRAHLATFPGKFTRKVLETIDDDGAVRPGTTVQHGDPLVLAVKQRDRTHGSIHRGRDASWVDRSETWTHHSPGLVTDVEKTPRGIVVSVKSTNPSEVGDKVSGRYGDKGVIADIIPDGEMPHDAQGRPFEVLLNPLGIVSRTNPAQEIEAALGKIAERTGQPYRVVDFDDRVDYNEWAIRELARHGMKSKETIHDLVGMRDIPGVLTGNRWFMKLHHTSESKAQGRGTGGYTAEGRPARGGETGSKRISLMDINAILSHGACFMGSVNVLTEQGWLEISKIVRNRMPIRVACVDEATGKLTYRKVVDWLARCVPDEELMLLRTYARAGNSATRGGHQAIRVTRGHRIYTSRGKVQAYYLKPGDRLYTIGTKLEPWQEQLIIGTLLGDGYAGSRDPETKMSGLACVHGFDQQDYLQWKYEKLANFVLSPPRPSRLSQGGFAKKPTSRFTTRQHPQISAIAEEYYVDRVKSPPPGIVARGSWLGLGVWFGDDGGCVFNNQTQQITTFRFHTNAFSVAAVDRLVEELREFTGLPWRRYMQNGKYPIITLTNGDGSGSNSQDNLYKWIEMIRPYVPPAHAHKLRLEKCGEAWQDLLPPEGQFIEETTVKSIEPYKPAPYENNLVYNITVEEHHNYIVHGILVGNTEVLRDAGAVRGQQHPELWAQYMSGHPMPTPRTPIVYDKFLAQLRAAGINVVKDGTRLNVMALSGRDVDELAGDREIRHADTVDWKSGLKPIPGGLFDEQLTGGHNGNRWAFIRLPEPMPNPVMEEPIRRMLGLTEKKFLAVLAGQDRLDGHTGPGAIAHALDRIELPRAIEQARADVRSGRKGARDAAIRRLGYLKAAERTGVHPRDWLLDKVPVLPPVFRPVSVMGGSKLPMVADANYLYKEMLEAVDNFRSMRGLAADLGDERLAVYGAFKGVVGLGDPLHPKNRERQVKGVLRHVFGGSPKSGVVQRKLLGSSTDLVGRSVIVPDPGLDMDQVGLPEARAWEVYRPFIVRRLRRRGMAAADALRAVEDRTEAARGMLLEEMEERPVIINRAPVLHRYGMMAFRPRLTAGDTLRVPPLIVTGFGADFDGDAMQYHVPAGEGAVRDAYEKMLPSRNLLATANFKAHQLPGKEYGGGLYVASTARSDRRPRTFATRADALAAYRRGEVGPDQQVEVVQDS